MRTLLYILLVLPLGCHAVADFPDPEFDLPSDSAMRDLGSDAASTDAENVDLFEDLKPACGEPQVPAGPEFSLSQRGATLDATGAVRRVSVEMVPHEGHFDTWIAIALVDEVSLHIVHGDDFRVEPVDLMSEETTPAQDVSLWRSEQGVVLTVIRGACNRDQRITSELYSLASDGSTIQAITRSADCLEQQTRASLPTYRGGFNAFTAQYPRTIWRSWAEDGVGFAAVQRPEDAFDEQGSFRRIDQIAFSNDRSRSYSTGGSLVFVATRFDFELYETRWWDPARDERLTPLDFRSDGSILSIVHLSDEIYMTAHRDRVEDHVEIRLYAYNSDGNTLSRHDVGALELFPGNGPDQLDLASFEGGVVLVEWVEDAEGDRARFTTLDVDLGELPKVSAGQTWTSLEADRSIADHESRAVRDGCDLLVSVATMWGDIPDFQVDHSVYRFRNFAGLTQ